MLEPKAPIVYITVAGTDCAHNAINAGRFRPDFSGARAFEGDFTPRLDTAGGKKP